MLYGFPRIDGTAGGIKVATESYENLVDPDHVQRDVSEESIAAMYSEYIAPRFPDLEQPLSAHGNMPVHRYARRQIRDRFR